MNFTDIFLPLRDTYRMARGMFSFVHPFLKYHLASSIPPVLAGYKITHRCNLRCRHCPYWKRSGRESDFSTVVSILDRLAAMGVRILILEGGEPMLWRDGRKEIGHVVEAARKRFPCVCMTTNGILPWDNLPLNRVWISLDGPPALHDETRGEGVFERVWANLESQGHGRSFISTSIGRHNAGGIHQMMSLLKGTVEGVTIQFHYPYNGLPDPLFIDPPDRAPILDELIRLKRRGYPVANSFESLTELRKDRWTCEDRLLANAEPDGTILHGCYLKNRGPSVCAHCGFSAHNEMSLAFKGHPESIMVGLKVFFSGSLPEQRS